jgi:hypothetical protein
MKKYKCIKVCPKFYETETNLNLLAQAGWEVKCSYSGGNWIIMEKEIEEMDIDDEDFIEFADYADFETQREDKAKRNKAHPYSKTSRGKHSLDRKK